MSRKRKTNHRKKSGRPARNYEPAPAEVASTAPAGGAGTVGGMSDPADEVPCSWLFVPLPEHLPVPHGWQIGEEEDLERALEASKSGRLSTGLSSSMCVLQAQRSTEPLHRDLFDILRGAVDGKQGYWSGDPEDDHVGTWAQDLTDGVPPDAATSGATLTIVEVAFPDNQLPAEDLLDEAIERVRWLQQGVSILTQRPVRLVGRRCLPPMLPTLSGRLRVGMPTYDRFDLMVVERSAPPTSYDVPTEDLNAEQLKSLPDAISAAVERRAFMDFADLRREAFVQHHVNGNGRLAVATYATAGEVLVTGLVLHLLWEEGVDPYGAADAFDMKENHSDRIARALVPRLGGNWSSQGREPAARYFQDLVYLRHRVVHAGHEPSDIETDDAGKALTDFEKFIGDRLCDPTRLNRYTRTAMAYVGGVGIRRRGRWTKKVEQLVNDPDQPDWAQSFRRWRAHFDLALAGVPEPPQDLTGMHLVADVVDGEARYFLWDPDSLRAVDVDPLAYCSAAALKHVELLITEQPEATGRVRLLDPTGTPPADGWVPDYEHFADLTVAPGP